MGWQSTPMNFFGSNPSFFALIFLSLCHLHCGNVLNGCGPCETQFARLNNATGVYDIQCRCANLAITEVPQNMSSHLTKLEISNTGITQLTKDVFKPYRKLTHIIIHDLQKLKLVDAAAFSPLTVLMKISITDCKSLVAISGTFLAGNNRLLKLDLSNNNLKDMPHLRMTSETVLTPYVDISSNQISVIKQGSITSVALSFLILKGNQLERIENAAFNGSQITNLVLSKNPKLSVIKPNAFTGLTLQKLDLSDTSITTLEIEGLKQLEFINVKNVETLKVIPNVLAFTNLKRAIFHYPYHCCFFSHAKVEAVFGGEEAKDEIVKEWKRRFCHDQNSADPYGTTKPSRSKRAQQPVGQFGDVLLSGFGAWGDTVGPKNKSIRREESSPFDQGTVHEVVEHHNSSDMEIICSSAEQRDIAKFFNDIVCTPMPNALNPCEDVMGGVGPRVVIWFVWIFTILGNVAVIAVLLVTNTVRMRVHNFLIVNLAIADLCTGLYLAMLSVEDMMTKSKYYNYAVEWQTGNGCKVAGFLTVFASELSVATMLLISYDVWYNTRNIFYGRSLGFGKIIFLMGLSWAFAIGMAALPLVGVSSYSATSTCLPLKADGLSDRLYLFFGLGLNIFAFTLMCVFYINIYCDVSCTGDTASPTTRGQDLMIAKRMAILIGANFICWGPTVLFGLTAAANTPLINIYASKWLLVLCYPINSFANPFLYVFLTKRYRESMTEALRKYEFLQGVLFTRPSRPVFTKDEWQLFNGTQTTFMSNKTPRPSDSSIKSSNNSTKLDPGKQQTFGDQFAVGDKTVASVSPLAGGRKITTATLKKFIPQMSDIIENSNSGSHSDDQEIQQCHPLLSKSSLSQTIKPTTTDTITTWCDRTGSSGTIALKEEQKRKTSGLRKHFPGEFASLRNVKSLRSRLTNGRPNSLGSANDFYCSDNSLMELFPARMTAAKRPSVDQRSNNSAESGYNTSSPMPTPDPSLLAKRFLLPVGRQTADMTSGKSFDQQRDYDQLIRDTKV